MRSVALSSVVFFQDLQNQPHSVVLKFAQAQTLIWCLIGSSALVNSKIIRNDFGGCCAFWRCLVELQPSKIRTSKTNEKRVFKNQQKPVINDVIAELCERTNQCSTGETVHETIDNLRHVSTRTVYDTWRQMKNENPSRYGSFSPVTNDGVFFKEDAKVAFDQCNIPFTGSAIIGSNSFEGNLMYYGK